MTTVVPDYTRRAVEVLADAWSGEGDFAGWLAAVLTAAAARVGGDIGVADTLVMGRSGSWEAEHVRALVEGTTDDSEADLARWRAWPPES